MTKKAAAVEALREFFRSAQELSNQWPDDGSLDEGYPECLPSFDEFVAQVDRWLEKAQRQPG